jgi:15-cis-phytoene desaturase
MEKHHYDVIIIGAGLAGLTCGIELVEKGYKILVVEAENVVGGRTSSWLEDGMHVESGFHRVIGYQKNLKATLAKAGVNINKIVMWEESIEVRSPRHKDSMILGIAPVHGPIKMLKGVLGNNDVLSLKDKISIIPFFTKGLLDYLKKPEELDKVSVQEYAKKHGVTDNALHMLLIPLSTGLFFLPPEKYSAYVFFGLMAPAIPRIHTMRIGAYLGGMTEVMAIPMADYITEKGGEVLLGKKVTHLVFDGNKVDGIYLGDEKINASQTVLATELGAAKRIINNSRLEDKFFKNMISLPTMPAVTVQIELDKPILPKDRTTFGTGTALVSFSEQSRTTFTHVPGRLSIILGPAAKYLTMSPEEIIKIVIEEAQKINLDIKPHIIDYRIVSHPEDFHTLEPGYNWMRPDQKTPIKGLTLAGDYTKQSYFATMEGAVVSGKKASNVVMKNLR